MSCSVFQHDDQKVKDYGVKLAIDMIRRLTTEANIPGVHFSTLNLEKSVQRVVEGLGWIERLPSVLKPMNKLIAVRNTLRTISNMTHTLLLRRFPARALPARPQCPRADLFNVNHSSQLARTERPVPRLVN